MKNFIKKYDLFYNIERTQGGIKDLYSYGATIKSFMDNTSGEEGLSKAIDIKLKELLIVAHMFERISNEMVDLVSYHADNETSWLGYKPNESLRVLLAHAEHSITGDLIETQCISAIDSPDNAKD